MAKWLFNRPWELEPSPTRTIFQFPWEFELTEFYCNCYKLLGKVATAWLQSWRSIIIVPKRSSHRFTVHISYFSVWLSRSRAAVVNSLGELKLGGAQRPRWMEGHQYTPDGKLKKFVVGSLFCSESFFSSFLLPSNTYMYTWNKFQFWSDMDGHILTRSWELPSALWVNK